MQPQCVRPTPISTNESPRMATKEKLTLYFPPDLLEEARQEALRQDRTVSWILQKAWQYARQDIRRLPNADGHYVPFSDQPVVLRAVDNPPWFAE